MRKMPITIKWTVNCRTIFSMARDLVGHPETATSLDLAADRDQWSKITRIIAHKMNRRINSGKGFISSSDVPWSEWSRIAYPDPYHPKGTHPCLEYLTFAWLFHSNFLPDMRELCYGSRTAKPFLAFMFRFRHKFSFPSDRLCSLILAAFASLLQRYPYRVWVLLGFQFFSMWKSRTKIS